MALSASRPRLVGNSRIGRGGVVRQLTTLAMRTPSLGLPLTRGTQHGVQQNPPERAGTACWDLRQVRTGLRREETHHRSQALPGDILGIGVMMAPRATALTLTLWVVSSSAGALVAWPPLDERGHRRPGRDVMRLPLDREKRVHQRYVTMTPGLCYAVSARAMVCGPRKQPVRFTRMVCSHSSSERSSTRHRGRMPAHPKDPGRQLRGTTSVHRLRPTARFPAAA